MLLQASRVVASPVPSTTHSRPCCARPTLALYSTSRCSRQRAAHLAQAAGPSTAAVTAAPPPTPHEPETTATLATPAAAATSASAYSGPAAATTGASASKENFTGDMLQPSAVNTPWARALSVAAAVAVASGSSAFLPLRLAAFLNVTAYGLWLGTQIWNTFFVGLTMFKNVPRQTFGRVQAKLFPSYFALTAGCNLLVIGTLLVLSGRLGALLPALGPMTATAAPAALAAGAAATNKVIVTQGVALATSFANWLYLEPLCTGLMFRRYDIENKEGEKTEDDKAQIAALYKQFGKWHGISSLLNLIGLCCTISYGWHIATLLVPV